MAVCSSCICLVLRSLPKVHAVPKLCAPSPAQAMAAVGTGNWQEVARRVRTRTNMQCRERWENVLNPALKRRQPWTRQEVGGGGARLLCAMCCQVSDAAGICCAWSSCSALLCAVPPRLARAVLLRSLH